MTVTELLAQLREKNVELSIKGDDLVVRAKERALESPELLARLRENKKALIDLIKAGRYVGPNGAVQAPPNRIPPDCDAITPDMLPLIELKPEEIERIVSATPGGASNVQDIYPLVPFQEGILFHHLMATEGDPYLLNVLCVFDSRARVDAFLKALQFVIDRHDALRTSILWEGLAEPAQVVWRRAPLAVEEISLDPAAGDIAEQMRARFNPRHYRIDVRLAPMTRVFIARDSLNDRWVMLALNHHLSVEGASLKLMLEEISAYLLGRSGELPAPLPFRDFVARLRFGVSNEESEAFFREMLGDIDEPTAPFGLTNAHGDGSGIVEAVRAVDVLLVRRLRRQARTLGVSVASLFHLAWAMVLARVSRTVSGRDDVVFGTALFGRMRDGEETRRMLGVFINTLPVRIRVGDESVRDGVRQTHTLLTRLLHHEHASLALAQRSSAVEAPAPLFSALLNYRHGAREATSQAPASAELQQAWDGVVFEGGLEQRTNYPVTLQVDDLGENLILNALAQSPADPERICAYMNAALEQMAEALERAPSTPVGGLDVTPYAERRQLLVEWSRARADLPRDQFIHELFENRAAACPESDAVEWGDARLTYGALNAMANRLAHHLRKLGIKPDSRVGLCVERSPDMLVGLLAVLKAGAAYVPLDPEYPVERLTHMVADSAPVAVLTNAEAPAQAHAAIRLALAESAGAAPMIYLDADARRWAKEPDINPDRISVGLTPEHLAYVIYTSGSTGGPKGVMVEHRGLANYLLWAAKSYAMERGAVVSSSLSFDATITSLLTPLICGAPVRLLPVRGEVDGLADLVRSAAGCGLIKITPSHLDALGRRLLEEKASASASMFVVGGEALSPATVEMWRRIQPGARIVNEYGPTETVVGCVVYEIPRDFDPNGSVPIGRPITNTHIYILDRRLRPAPVGVIGEIYIGGAGVARGYLNQPELTAERFVELRIEGDLPEQPRTANKGSRDGRISIRVYRSGDLGRYLPDGAIEFLGRNDSQIKIRGYRIEPGEIESALARHPAIREAVALARDDEFGSKQLIAFYTLKTPEDAVDLEMLRDHLLTITPEYMAPAAYVRLETLPLTPNGKLDRKALLAVGAQSGAAGVYEAPVGKTEIDLARIWADALKVERVGRHDNFFALGGHSLLAIRVASRIRQALGVEIRVSEFFDRPVLREFARTVSDAARDELPPITIIRRDQPLPVSFAQQRLWFLTQIEGVSQAYHIPLGLRLKGRLNLEALIRALDRLVARHEALRTTFTLVDGLPIQRIAAEDCGFTLREHDISRSADPEDDLRRLAAEEASDAFDLEIGPLIRGRLIKLGHDDHALLVTMHHIISDGWSMGVLINEMSALYRAYDRGQPDPLPALAIQYADYAAWQRRWVTDGALRAQAEYWRRELAGAPALLTLPTDRPRAAKQDHSGAFVGLDLDEGLASDLKDLSRRHGVTLFMTLLSAWAATLARLAGQKDLVVGVPVANRARTELEPLIGLFVNTLALRLDLSGSPTVSGLLQLVKTRALAAQDHQDIPFESVVEIANPPRSLSHTPLFQVMFVWQNNEEGDLDLPELSLSPAGAPGVATKFELTLNLAEAGDRIIGGLEYSTALFDQSAIERHVGHLRNALRAMVADDGRIIDRIDLLSQSERRQLLMEWNGARSDYPNDRLIHELFESQAERRPDSIALVCADGQLNYGELNARANRLARHLRELGVEPETRAAICMERGADMVVGLLAVLKAGGAYIPIDPAYPVERLRYMLSDSAPVAILTHAVARGSVRSALDACEAARVIDLRSDAERWEKRSDTDLDPRSIGLTPDHPAYVIYTSGSTGKPKGVIVGHRGLCNLASAQIRGFAVEEESRVLQFASMSFDASVSEIFMALCGGASLHAPPPETILAGQRLREIIEQEEITHVTLPPAALATMPEQAGLESLRALIVAGEASPEWLVRRWAEGRRMINAYGPTEATVCATMYECSAGNEVRPPIGRPIANARIYILDEYGEPAPIGVTGEIHIGGVQLARGYLNRHDLTAERFVADPFTDEPNTVMYRTGDLARYLADENIEFLGRNDFQIKIRGFRIEPGEIEAHLAGHPAVGEAVVLAREDSPGVKRLVAYYTAAMGAEAMTLGAEELRESLASVLPEYMLPVAYVVVDALPLTPNGKLDRDALPAPERESYAASGYAAPDGETEIALAGIWADLLQIERIGRHDNFFDLGGHSLLMMKLISRIQAEFGVKIAIQGFFENPSLTSLARLVLQAQLAQFAPEDISALLNRL